MHVSAPVFSGDGDSVGRDETQDFFFFFYLCHKQMNARTLTHLGSAMDD